MVLHTIATPPRAGWGWLTAFGLAAALVHVGCSSDAESPANPGPGAAAGASAGGKTAVSAAGGAAEGGARNETAVAAGASGEPTFAAAGESMGGAGELAGDAAGAGGARAFDPQRPPTDTTELAAWLSAGFYKDWVCETAPTAKTDGASAIHAHGNLNRVCSNLILAASSAGAGREFPEGAASVKEIYDQNSRVTAIAVSVKVAALSDGGNGWFWFEGTAAGKGLAGCTGCHSQAGADANHPGAGDFVYFQNAARP